MFSPQTPPPKTQGMGSVHQTATFSDHSVAYQIKKHHSSKYFAHRSPAPTPTLRMGSIGQTSTFSEHGHVAYQIKENHKYSNMIANSLPAYRP